MNDDDRNEIDVEAADEGDEIILLPDGEGTDPDRNQPFDSGRYGELRTARYFFSMLLHFQVPQTPGEPESSPPDVIAPAETWFARALALAQRMHDGVHKERINGAVELVHGSACDGTAYPWVELPAALVFDPATGRLYRALDHYLVLAVEPLARYAVPAAEKLAAQHRHAGPWPR